MKVSRSNVFIKWLNKLKDKIGKALINERITRIEEGNFGDCYPIGDGLTELRIHFGPAIVFILWTPERKLLFCFVAVISQHSRVI